MPLRGSLRLFLQAFGPGARQLPCKARPEPASMLALPALRKHVGNFQPTSPHLSTCVFCLNSKTDLTGSQRVEAIPPVRLKIDEALTADRVCPQGCGQRGRPAGTQARPRPDRQTE
ncbi:hypothetical protein C6985_09020 [Escherichia coli]|nr:hypothetical protein C6985_09020 [Escherichia coli]